MLQEIWYWLSVRTSFATLHVFQTVNNLFYFKTDFNSYLPSMHCSSDCDPTKSYFIFLISKKKMTFQKLFFRNFHFTKGRHSGGRVSRSFSDCLGSLRFHVHDRSSLLRRTWNFNSEIRLQNRRKHRNHTTVHNQKCSN